MKKLISIALVVVMLLGMIPSTIFAETTNTEDPVSYGVDGIVSGGEYTVTRTVDIPEGVDSWTAEYADGTVAIKSNPYAEGARKASFHLSTDGKYLYFAAVLETTGTSNLIRLGAFTNSADLSNNTSAWTNSITSAGAVTKGGNISWTIAESKVECTTDDAGMNTYVYEAKAALSEIGTDLSAVYVNCRLYSTSDGFIYLKDSIAIPEIEPEVTEPEVTEPETTEPAEPDYASLGQNTYEVPANKVPNLNGEITDGEYATTIQFDTANGWIEGASNVTDTTLFFSYDENNLYVGGIVDDVSTCDCQHPAYERSIFVYICGDASDMNNAWKIYLCKQNGASVEHWKITDGNCSSNLWNPYDSKNADTRKHGLPDKNYVLKSNYVDGSFIYELSIDLDEWGITGDELFIAAGIQSHGGYDYFGFKSEELLASVSSLQNGASNPDYGLYPHAFKLTEEVVTEPVETEPVETEPVETEPVADPKGYELTEYGQKHYYIGNDTTDKAFANTKDTVDGAISEGEYTWSKIFTPENDDTDNSYNFNGITDVSFMKLYATVKGDHIYFATVIEDSDTGNGWIDYLYFTMGGGEYTRSESKSIVFPTAGSQLEFGGGFNLNPPSTYVKWAYDEAQGKEAWIEATEEDIAAANPNIDKYVFKRSGTNYTYEWRVDLNKYTASDNKVYVGIAYQSQGQVINFNFNTDENVGQNAKLTGSGFGGKVLPHVFFLGEKSDFSELGGSFVNCTEHNYANGAYISDTEHRIICSVCGHIEYAAHTLVVAGGTQPTYTQAGSLVYACEAGLCGGKLDPQVPALGTPDAHLLTKHGQKHGFVSAATEATGVPTVDGTVDPMEYNWSVSTEINNNTTTNPAFNITTTARSVKGMTIYASQDSDNIYIAVQINDPSHVGNDYTYILLGAGNTMDNKNVGFYIPYYGISKLMIAGSGIEVLYTGVGNSQELMDKYLAAASGKKVGNTVTYELAFKRDALEEYNGIDSFDKLFLQVYIDLDYGKTGKVRYAFNAPELSGLVSVPGSGAPYSHVLFLGEKGEFADFLDKTIQDDSAKYVECATHSYTVLNNDTQHKQICTVCGAVAVAEHTWNEQTVTVSPSFGVVGYSYKTCSVDGCDAEQVVEGSEKYFDPNANATGTTQYTLWQNNIMQNSIQENCYANTNHKTDDHDWNGDKTVDSKDEFYFLPSVTKDIWSKGTTKGRYQSFYSTLEAYMPDIVALQECDYGWHVVIDTHDEIVDGKFGSYGANTVEEGYTYTYNGKSVTTYPIAKLGYASVFEGHATIDKLGVRSPIYYNTEVFELVESGIDDYPGRSGYFESAFVLAWAILRAKDTGECIAVTSTHLPADYSGADSGLDTRNQYAKDTILAKVKEFETIYQIPVISVGDYNADIYEAGMVTLNDHMKTGREDALVGKNLSWMTSGNSLGNRPYDANNLPSSVYLGPNGDEVYRVSDNARIGSQIDHCFYSEAGIAGDEWEVRIDDNSYCDHVPALFTFRVVGVNHECENVEAKAWTKLDDTKHFRKCICNELYEEADHNVATYTQNADGVTHSGACTGCGATVTLACTAANANYEQTATTHDFTCSVCTGTVSADHTFTWTFTGTTADDTHTKTCSVCGYVAVNAAKHVFDNGKITKPATPKAYGEKTYTCECGAFYTKTWATDGHFLASVRHFFAGNALAAAPKADGILNSAEYSWSSGLLATNNTDNNAWKTAGRVQWCIHAKGCVNSIETFLGYDEDNVYVALVSYYDGTRPATEEVRVYLGGGESISRIVGFKGVFTNGKLTTDMQYFDMTGVHTEATGYTIKDDFASKDSALDALAEACFNSAAAKVTGNALVYEVVIDRDALAAACGADVTLDRLYFQPAITGVNASGVRNGWIASCVENRGSNTRKNLDNYMDFLYINGTFPNVMFLSTKANQSAYLADNADHSGWNNACTAHNYRLVYAGNDTHKNVCVLCGAEEAAVACTMSAWAFADNGVHTKTCDVCKYVVYEDHDLGEVTSGNNGTHFQTCSVCEGTITNDCDGDWTTTDTTHTTVCSACGYNTPVEGHEFEYTYTGTTATDTHTGTCTACGYKTATATHTFGDPVGDPEGGFNTVAYAKYTCTVCGAYYKEAYAPDAHFLTAYTEARGYSKFNGQQHFFLGVESYAPSMDGVIGDSEYSVKVGGMTPAKSTNWKFHNTGYNTWGATTVIAAADCASATNASKPTAIDEVIYYFAYDAEYIYLAAVKDSAVKPTGSHYQSFVINVNDAIDVKLGKTVQLTYNTSGTPSVNSNGGGALTGYSVKLNEVGGRYQTVFEFKVSRAKLAELAGIESFDKFYLSAMSELYGPDGTKTGYGALLWQFTGTNFAATNSLIPAELKQHFSTADGLNRLGHVLFLGSNNDFADYLNTKDDPILGSYYRACEEHVYRTVATDEGHKQMCQHCGQTTGDVTPHSYNGVWTTPGTTSAAGIKTYTCLCGASYTRKEVNDAHFIRGTSHVFLGNKAGVAPKTNGVIGAAEYSWTSGTLGAGGKNAIGQYQSGLVNLMTDYASYDENYIYFAVVSSLEGANAGVARPATESTRVFLGANENWNSMVGFNLTYTHATGALTSKATHYQVLKTFETANYANLTTIDTQSADKVTKTDASACLVDVVAKYDAATNSLVYELVIDRAALAAACGNDTKLDRIFFQTGVTGITSAGAASGWLVTRNSSEYRGGNFVYGSDTHVWSTNGKTDDGTRANAVHNSHEFPYINGTFPHVMFLSTKTDQASYLGDNEVHTGWNAACTAHSFRTVIASETAHKQVCNLCGFEQTVENHVYDNTCDTTCNTCGYVREITHTEGDAATCTAAQTCTVCGIELAPALGHTTLVEKAAAVPATCTVDGKTAVMGCERCDALNEGGETITAAGHKYDDEFDAECNNCGEIRDVSCKHSYDKVVFDPTCTTDGYTTYTCSKCGDTYKDDEIVAAGHKYDTEVTDPTCEAEGYTTYTCSVCGDTYVDNKVDATGHATKVVDNKNGTHSTVCDTCGEVISTANCEYGENVSVDADNHKKTCDVCGSVVTAAHKLAWSSTGNTASDKHTKACSDCGYVAVAETAHSFTGVMTTPTTPSAYGTMTYTCECGAKWTETRATDAHFLRYQNHFFTGNALAVAPKADGVVNPAEYATMIEMYGNNKSAANQWIGSNTNKYIVTTAGTVNYFNIYMGFDADYIYLAGESILKGDYATATRNTTELIQFCLGGSEDISQNVKVRGTYNIANGTYTTNVWFYNADKLYANGAVPAQTSDLANAVLADSKGTYDKDSNTLTIEFKISRAKLAEICGEDEKIDKIYFAGEATGVQVTDGVAKTGGSIWQALEFYTANQITPIAGQFYYLNGKFPHVLLLGTQENFAGYLADTTDHKGFYKACAGHTYKYVAGEDTHKQVCTYCGFETDADDCVFSDWAAVEGESYHAKTCNTCGYVVKEVHAVTKWTDNKNGTHTGTCNACGGGEITADCDYGTWTKVDEATHGKTCSYCGNTVTGTHTSTGAGTIVTPAKLSADGTKSFTCTTCNTAYTKSYSTDDGYYFLINATGSGMYDVTGGAMKHFFLGNAMTKAPKLDGVIGDGEYNIEIYGPNKEQFTVAGWSQFEDGFNRFKTNCQTGTKTDSATTYMAYDATNIYLAYAVHTDAATIGNQQILVYLSSGDLQKDAEQEYKLNGKVAGNSGTSDAYSYVQTYVADADGVGGTMYYEFVINREILVDKYDTDIDTADVNKFFYRSFIYCYNDAGASAGYILHCPTWDQPVVNGVDPVGRNPHAIYLGTKASFADELTAGAAIFGATYDTTCSCSDDTFRLVMGETTHKEVCYKCGAERNEIAHAYDNACDATCNTCAYTRTVADHVYDNACDADCNVCGATRTAADHVYDNTCDTTCNTCGYVREITHTWVDADCDTPKTCSVCGATEGAALGHDWTDATCTAPKTCETCGETEGEALGHDWADATCTAPKTCETCGETEGEALGHDWADATCTAPKTCETCGETEGEALGHDWADATCTAPKTCETCGETDGEALGHTWIDADCDTPKTCSVCGATEGTALGHNEIEIPAVDATCTAEGATAGVKCDRCDEVLEAPVATPKAEHTYDDQYDAACNVCGFVREAVEVAAMIGDKKFATVKDAFDAAVEGDTIVVLTRIVVDGNETWDLTGKTLDIQYTMDNYVVLVKGNLTIKGGTFNIANAYGIGVQPGATLAIDGGTFTTTADNYLIGSWGTTTINGGEFNAVYCNVNGFAGTLTIYGGEFTISGYTGEYDALDVLAGDGVATIFGGSFSTDISEYIAKEYIATVVDGRYVVAACTHENKTTTETDRVEADCITDGSYVEIVTCDDCGKEISRETKTITALGHTDGEIVVENEVAADCVNNGSYDNVTYCTVCGAETGRETITVEATGHRYGNLQVFTFCLEEGYITIACGDCGAAFDSRTDVEAQDYLVEYPFFNLAAKGHTDGEVVVENEVAADCVNGGSYENVVYCTVCDEELSRETIGVDALGHTDGEIVVENEVAADCVNDGSYDNVTYCTVCGAETSRETIAVGATGHTPGAAATCTTAQICTVCDEILVAAIGHVEGEAVRENETKATCTTGGKYDSVVYCSKCDAEISRVLQTVEALGHTEGEIVVENNVAADCVTAGSYDNVVYCTECNDELSRATITVEALGHTEEKIPAVDATCTATGLTEGVKCSVCDTVITAQVIVPTVPHTEEKIPAVEATCTKTGLTEGVKCSVCGVVTTAQTTVKKLDHTYSTATNAGDGLHRFTCEVCDTTRTERHNFAADAETCTECKAEKETKFDGKDHAYAGAPATEENTPDVTTDTTFDAEKYNEITPENEWAEENVVDHSLYTTYNTDKLYLAIEIDFAEYNPDDVLSLSIETLTGEAHTVAIPAIADGQVRVNGAFTTKVYRDGNKVVFAIEIDRAMLAIVDTASTGNSNANNYLISYSLNNGEANEIVVTAEAEEQSDDTLVSDGDSTSIDIFGSYNAEDAEKVISVSLEWEVPTFTYTAVYEWSAEQLKDVLDAEKSGWSTTPASITVKNNSNQSISATFAFATTVSGSEIDGKFTSEESIDAEAITSVVLGSAAPAEGETVGATTTETVYFYITSGVLAEDYEGTIGNITITIGAEG